MSADQDADGREARAATFRRLELEDAVRLVVGTQYGSAAMLERHLPTTRARADELVLQLEEAGVLGPLPNVGKARPVLVRAERVDEVLHALLGPQETP